MRQVTPILSDEMSQDSLRARILGVVENLGKSCLGCNRADYLICPECLASFHLVETLVCPVCGDPSLKGFAHPRCRARPSLDRLLSVFRFEGVLRKVIHLFKYRNIALFGDLLARQVFLELSERDVSFGDDAVFVPSPMHLLSFFRRRRLYNHADILAQNLAKSFALPFNPDILMKVWDTKSQTALKRQERRENVDGAFWVPFWRRGAVLGRDFVVVDDVTTSGATLNECAKTLKGAGARYVYGLTVARD